MADAMGPAPVNWYDWVQNLAQNAAQGQGISTQNPSLYVNPSNGIGQGNFAYDSPQQGPWSGRGGGRAPEGATWSPPVQTYGPAGPQAMDQLQGGNTAPTFLDYNQQGPNQGYKIDPSTQQQQASDAAANPYGGQGGDSRAPGGYVGGHSSTDISNAYYAQNPRPDGAGAAPAAPTGPDYQALNYQQMLASSRQATDYQNAQMDLANRRFAWEQSQAAAAAKAADLTHQSAAVDSHNKTTLDYMGAHPTTGANVAAGYFAQGGQSGSYKMPVDPYLQEYYKANPGAEPTSGPTVGYTGAQALGAGDMQHMTLAGTQASAAPGQMTGNQVAGNRGIDMSSYMYGNRTPDGTPVPLGPQQMAAMGAAGSANSNDFKDYVGNYAGFDPNQMLNQSVGTSGTPLKDPSNFSG